MTKARRSTIVLTAATLASGAAAFGQAPNLAFKPPNSELPNPYRTLRQWAELPLRDKRVKKATEKRVVKSFRLEPKIADQLKAMAAEKGCTETEVIERLVRGCKNE